MAEKTLNVKIISRHDTETNWIQADPVLLDGEVAYSSDKNNRYKVGDGTSKWSALAYSKADPTSHTHTKSQISDFPTSLKNPSALTIQFNGTTNKTYDGSSAQTVNITPGGIGAATSGHTHSTASTSAAGFLRQLNGSTANFLRGDGTWATPPNTTYSTMKGATSSAAGATGLVPAPAAGKQTSFLRGDGTWVVPTNTNTTYSLSKSGSTITLTGSDGSKTSVTDSNTTYSLSSFGITATAAELNYIDGVTSNVQAQLNNKAASSHTHNYAGSSSAGGSANSAVKLNTSTAGSATQPVYFSGGKPVACTYTLGKSVPSNAVFTDTNTWIAFKGATTSAAGTAGYVPAPAAGAANRYFRSDGVWAVPPNTNTTYTLTKSGSTITLTGSDGSKTSVADSNTTYSLSSFGITATAAELNYMDGVTSKVQTQLNGKASTGHTHNYAGSSSAGGNANAAVKLATARTINGTSFDGTANITTANWGTSRTLTIGNTGKSVNGSGNVSWSLSEIGAAAITHTHSYLPLSGGTLTGTLKASKGEYVHYATGTSGTSGYINIATIKISATYQNIPISFEVYRRGTAQPTKLYITFTPTNGTDPTLNTFYYQGAGASTDFALYKSATSTWNLYINKTESYDDIGIAEYYTNFHYMSGTTVTFTNTQVSSVPSGATNATLLKDSASSVSGTLTIQTNGTTKASYNGSASATVNITPSSIGAAASSHTHNYAGSSKAGGSATSAVKLDTSTAGSATKPVYFSGGKPVACTYTLAKSVPSNAVFTDTNTTNTAGSTNTSSKIFLVGATSQASAPVTYSHDTVYVGTDGCIYSSGLRVATEVYQSSEPTAQVVNDIWMQAY